jgi:hypothetical protein
MKITINRDLITDRMNMLGLSERAMVKRTQLPLKQFRQARQVGQFDDHTPLSQLHRLATELGISLVELLSAPTSDAIDEPTAASTEDDVETLIPILVSVPNLVSVAHAARVLGWSRDHMENVLAAVPARLEGTGLRLHHFNGRAKIVAIDSPGKAVAHAIGRLQTMTLGLKLNQAQTLRRIINGETVFQRNIRNEDKLTLGALKNMGCLELDEKAQYQPTADLRLVLPDIK